jgi:hypothetical protein
MFNIQIRIHILYLKPLSVRAQYSNSCPTNSSLRCQGSLRHLNNRTGDQRKIKVKVILRPTVRPDVRHPSGTRKQYFPFSLWLFLDSCGFVHVGSPLWREDGSVVFSFCRASPAQPFSELSPTGLMYRWSKSHYDRHMSRPVRLGVRRPSGTRDQFFYLLEIFF